MSDIVKSQGETGLAIVSQRELTPQIWTMISSMAPVMYKSRLFGVTSEEAATAIMLKGYEMGMSITASFELIQVVLGKPGLSPRGALALLFNSPRITKIKVTEITDGKGAYLGHECFMQRDNGFEYTTKFTLEDAKKAGLVKPGSGWESYPRNMCQWRAIGFCADMVAPDVTAGLTILMKAPEQFGMAISDNGDIITVNSMPAPAKVEATPVITLTELCDKYGAEQVMIANEGTIPRTNEECAQVATKLGGV